MHRFYKLTKYISLILIVSMLFDSTVIHSYAESAKNNDSEVQVTNTELPSSYTEKLNFEEDERQWINDQIQKGLGRNTNQTQVKDLSSSQQLENKEAISVQETSDRDLNERLIRLTEREINEALTKSNEELAGLNLQTVASETGVDENQIQEKLDNGYTLQEGTSISKTAEKSRVTSINSPKTVVNTSETAKSEIVSDLGDIDLTVMNDFLAKALPPKPVKPDLELLKIKTDEAPFKINHASEDISTVSGSLSLSEPDLTLPGRNGLSFTLTRNYDSGSSQLYEADVKENVSSVPVYNINTNYKVDVYGTIYYLNYNYHVLNNKYKCSDNSLVLQESSWYDPSTPTHKEFSSMSERSSFYNSLERYKVEDGPNYCTSADRYYLHQFYLVAELTSSYQYLYSDTASSEDGPYLYADAQNAVSYFNSQKGKLAFSESDAGYDYRYNYDYATPNNTPVDSYAQTSYSNNIVDSKDQKRAPLGIGWTWNIPYLTFDNGTFVHLANGSSYKVEQGVLKGYPWKDLSLVADTSVTVNGLKSTQVLKNVLTGEKQYFDDKGKVLQISDSYNNNTTFKYADVAPYSTLLTEITDAIGNKITIQYTTSAVTLTMGDRQVVYKKTVQDGKELLTQVIDPMNRKTTYDYSISTAKFDLLSSTPTTQNPYALITGVTYPTGAKTVYEYESTPFKRYSSASSVNEVYRIAARKDVLSYSDQTTSDFNRMSFIYPTDMGSSFDADMNFTTKTFSGQVETLYTYKKDYIDSQSPPMIYNTNIEASDLTTKKLTNNTYDEVKRIPAPISTTTYYRTTSAESEHNTDSQTFDDYGNILTSTNALNRTVIYTYDPATHLRITEKWPTSSTVSLFIEMIRNQQGDVKDYKLKQNDTSGSTLQHTTYEYDSFGNVITTTDYDTTKQVVVKSEYDPTFGSAFLTKQTSYYNDADNAQQSSNTISTYDKLYGNMLTYTDGRNNQTSYQYDKLDRLTKETNPDKSFVTNVYDDSNNQTTKTDEAGVIVRTTFDGLGQVVKSEVYDKALNESSPSFKAKSKTGYDALSRKAWDEDAVGNRTAYTYDNWDRLVKTTNPDLSYSQVSYDDVLNTVTETDEENNSTKKYLDRLGRITKEQEIENGSYVTKTSTQYDDADNITQITTYDAKGAAGNVTKFSYDPLKQLRSVTTPKNEVFTYDYDQLGNSTGITYPDNKKIVKEYDELGQVIKYTDEAGKLKKMYYDAEGNLSKLIDRNNQTFTYQYDNRNRLLNRNGESETVSYQYYPDGKRKTMTDNTGVTLYGYNSFTGLLTSKTYPDEKMIQYGYDLRGNRTDLTDPFGRKITYGYDSVNRISTVKTDEKLTASYDYYRNDKIKTITHGNGLTSNFVYDGLDLQSLQHMKSLGALNTYKYVSDWSGNVTQRTENGQTSSYTYDSLGQILTNTQFNETYGYDPRGNRSSLTSDAIPSVNNFSYMYDEWNQLTKVSDKDKDSTSVEYTYNGDGQLYERYADGIRTRYYWDDQRLIAEATITNTSVNPKASYVYGNGLLERIDAKNLSRATYLLNGHEDVVELRDSTGNIILNSYTYDIWGKPTFERETIDNPFRYSSEYWDKKSGLQYLRARWYDPQTARFTTEDTYEGELKNPNSLNLYVYVENNPLTHSDPSGHSFALAGALLFVPGVNVIAAVAIGVAVIGAGIYVGIKVSKANSRVQENKRQGKNFEKKVGNKLKETETDVEAEITVRTKSGTRVRPDFLSKGKDGKIKVTDAKSSEKAPLTKNQRKGYPELEKEGGTVVGKGKGAFPGGTKIPPTKVKIIRPSNLQ